MASSPVALLPSCKGEGRGTGSVHSPGKAWMWLAHAASAKPGLGLPPHKDAGKLILLVPREKKQGR